jgi:flagellar M-ring protein FliF
MATTFDPSALLSDLIARYLKLPLAHMILYPIIFIGSITLIVSVSKWSYTPEYVTLFSDLSEPDSAAVIERLKEQKIQYEIRANGSAIAVTPPDLVHELRLTLASEGIPSGGKVGFEIFDTDNLGLTGFAERMKAVRALQGELERTISSIEGVRSARVHVTQPEKSVFSKKGNQATASVLLHLKGNSTLNESQLTGVVNLVAGSIEGLEVANVSIVDSKGNLLNPKKDPSIGESGVDGTRIDYQRKVEIALAERVEQMIEKVIGSGKVIAKVSAELDFSTNHREEENYDPGSQVLRSERTVADDQGGDQRGGVPGVVANLTNDPNLLAAPAGGDSTKSNHNESLKNYEISRALVKSSSVPGRLLRLSVAVLVDGTYSTIKNGEETVVEYSNLNQEMIDQIESLVKSAVGYDAIRGDTITVENIKFTQDSIVEPEDEPFDIWAMTDKVVPLVFIIGIMFIMLRLVKFITTPGESELNLERLLPSGIEDLEREVSAEKGRADVPELQSVVDMSQLEELIADNSRVVRENPQQAALLLRYWLNEGRL